MRFFFFTKGGKEVPSSRYRAYYLAEALQALGHETSVMAVVDRSPRAFFRYMRALFKPARKDVVFLQRTIYNRYFYLAVLFTRCLGRRFVFDIDDAVFEHSPFKTMLLVWLADFVTCGSEFVRSWVLPRNAHAYLLKNGLPLSIYTIRKKEPEGTPVIGWIGSGPAHYENLALLPPVLRGLRERGVQFCFRLIGALGDPRIHALFEGIADTHIVDRLDWADPRQAVAEIRTFAIGVMPLQKTQWNQARYFKALEYMACGIPVVASGASTLRHILSDAPCGALVEDTDQWIEAIVSRLRDPEKRRLEGEEGRRIVEREYSTASMAQRLVSLVS